MRVPRTESIKMHSIFGSPHECSVQDLNDHLFLDRCHSFRFLEFNARLGGGVWTCVSAITCVIRNKIENKDASETIKLFILFICVVDMFHPSVMVIKRGYCNENCTRDSSTVSKELMK